MNKNKAKKILISQIDAMNIVKATARYGYTFYKWFRDTGAALSNIFPSKEYSKEFSKIRFSARRKVDLTEAERQKAYIYGLELSEALLRSCIDEIDNYWDEEDIDYSKKYISDERINQLKDIGSEYDLSKLIELCRELNINYSAKNYYSVGMLVRATLDHVPPIFACANFSQFASEAKGRSLKDILLRLDEHSRKVADVYLHEQICKKIILPTEQQIDFKSGIDLLLSEIIRKTQ